LTTRRFLLAAIAIYVAVLIFYPVSDLELALTFLSSYDEVRSYELRSDSVRIDFRTTSERWEAICNEAAEAGHKVTGRPFTAVANRRRFVAAD